MSLPVTVFVLYALLKAMLISSTYGNYGYYREQVRCLSIVHFPVHGSMTFRGHFTLNLVCPGDYEDIPADAPGNPPGVLYCDQNLPNREILQLRLPTCLKMMPQTDMKIKMEITFTFRKPDSLCNRLAVNLASSDIYGNFNREVIKKINAPEVCPGCMITIEVRESTCTSGTEDSVYKITVGLLLGYDRSIGNEKYAKIWDNIAKTVNENPVEASRPGWTLQRIEFHPWTASCKHIANSVPTVLSLQNTVSCRGCSDSHYVDPYRGDRCLQCPFGYYIRNDPQTAGNNSATNCQKCPGHEQFSSRESYLRLCFDRY